MSTDVPRLPDSFDTDRAREPEPSREPVNPELFARTAPRWNCVDYPGDGMHYTAGDDCSWCGMTREAIAQEHEARRMSNISRGPADLGDSRGCCAHCAHGNGYVHEAGDDCTACEVTAGTGDGLIPWRMTSQTRSTLLDALEVAADHYRDRTDICPDCTDATCGACTFRAEIVAGYKHVSGILQETYETEREHEAGG